VNLTEHQKQWIAWGISTIVVLALSLTLGIKYPLPTPPEELPDPVIALGTTHFTNVEAEDLTATDDLTVTDDSTLTDDVTVGGDLTVSTGFFPSFADVTVTANYYLTPTKTIYALDSSGAVSLTLQATGTEGQILILIGDDANNVTVNDTNLRSNDGSEQVLNAYDVLMLVYQDDEWIEISESNDS
jgi:hypothetical protein